MGSASDMPRKDKEPSAYQFKSSLQYDNTRPKFLQNALAALAGGSGSGAAPTRAADGREPIPQRPDGDEYSDPASDEGDEWGFSRDDEAPTVVVLKEGKHVDRDEYDRLRAEHGTSMTTQDAKEEKKATGSLKFASGGGGGGEGRGTKRARAAGEDVENGTWDDVVKRVRGHGEAEGKKAQEEVA